MRIFALLAVTFTFSIPCLAVFGSEVDEIAAKMKEIAETSFEGQPENYLPFGEKKGTDLTNLADQILAHDEVSAANTMFAIEVKELGIALCYGADDARHNQKIEEFLESIKDIPEAKPRIRNIISLMSSAAQSPFYGRKNEENIAPFREYVDRFSPLINAHFEDAESQEQQASVMVFSADRYDPDGSAGLVLYTVEKLKPTLESHRQRRDFDLLRYCAESALGTAYRIQMPGKELEYQGVDLKGNLIDVKDYRGKFVLLIADASQDTQKIPALKKIYNVLHGEGLELIEFNTQHNTGITIQNTEQNEIPWIVTSLGARRQKQGVKDYREVYGGSRGTLLFAGKDGIVLKADARSFPPDLCEMLKSHFPSKAAILDEAAAEIRVIDDEREKEREKFYQERTPSEDSLNSPESHLRTILSKLFYVHDYAGIAATIKRELAETILMSPSLTETNRLDTFPSKVGAMHSLGVLESKRNPEKLPELVFAELLTYLDEVKQVTQGTPYYHNSYLITKLQVFHSMREHLKRSNNPVEYAKKIIDQYVSFAQEEMLKGTNTSGASERNIRSFVSFLQGDLENIDMNHSTWLSGSFLGQVIPIFESSSDFETRQYARQLSGAERRAALVGQELEFECALLDGETINVKNLRGKIVLINFWATTCGPCLAEFPNMKQLYEKYKPLGYEMIAYSCGDDDETLKAFVEREQHPWLVGSLLISNRKEIKNYSEFYGIQAIPTTFLLDREGIVRFMMVGRDDEALTKAVEKLFAEE